MASAADWGTSETGTQVTREENTREHSYKGGTRDCGHWVTQYPMRTHASIPRNWVWVGMGWAEVTIRLGSAAATNFAPKALFPASVSPKAVVPASLYLHLILASLLK